MSDRPHLTFRLLHPIGVVFLAVHREDDLARQAANHLVRQMLEPVMRKANPLPSFAGYVPEVISDETEDYIRALETALQDLRNAMIDAPTPAVADEEMWLTLIDRAGKLLRVI